jgi:hypothetical protein
MPISRDRSARLDTIDFTIRNTAPPRAIIEARNENWSEIRETPPMTSRKESELTAETPFTRRAMPAFAWLTREGVPQAEVGDVHRPRIAEEALGVGQRQVDVGGSDLRSLPDLEEADHLERASGDGKAVPEPGAPELGVVLLEDHLARPVGEAAFLEPVLHLDRAQRGVRQVDPHDSPESRASFGPDPGS